jgi:hypothetical protein
MAGFCGNCGFPLGANSAFCAQCGARQSPVAGGPAPAQFQQPASGTLVAAKSGSGLKIFVIIMACFLGAGILAVGAVYYAAHRVKQAVVEKAASYGVDLHSIPSAATSTEHVKRARACDLLSKDEAGRLLGEPIERTEDQSDSCFYYGPAGLSAKLAHDLASGTFQRAQTPGSNVDGSQITNALDQITNGIGAAAGSTGSRGEAPLLMLIVGTDGKAQMTALTATKALFGGIGRSGGAKGFEFGADVPGLGDRAVRLPKLGLNVLKGDMLVRIIAGPVPDADTKTINVARAVLPKL